MIPIGFLTKLKKKPPENHFFAHPLSRMDPLGEGGTETVISNLELIEIRLREVKKKNTEESLIGWALAFDKNEPFTIPTFFASPAFM